MACKGADADSKAKGTTDEQRRQVNMICAHMGLNVANLCVCLIARVSVLKEAGNLSGADAAQLLAFFSSGIGLVEFLLNPITGKLADAFGRKPFLMQAPAVSCLLKSLVVLNPSKLTVGLERCIAGACTTIGGSTACTAALADILDDKEELAKAYASLGTATGLGVVLGPILGGFAIGKVGRSTGAFAAGAMLSALQLGLISSRIGESLEPGKRKDLPPRDQLLAAVSPWTIKTLFTNGPVVASLSVISALQCFCEGKSISDLNTYYLLNDAKFSDNRRSLYISCLGVVMTASGMIGRQSIKDLGMRLHTTFQNIMTFLGFVLMGSTTSTPVIFSSLAFYAFAMERRAAINSLAVKAADQAGIGRGEFSAASANLRAIAVGVAPWLYAKVYAQSIRSKGNPGRPYYVAALIALIAEALHRTLSDAQLKFK